MVPGLEARLLPVKQLRRNCAERGQSIYEGGDGIAGFVEELALQAQHAEEKVGEVEDTLKVRGHCVGHRQGTAVPTTFPGEAVEKLAAAGCMGAGELLARRVYPGRYDATHVHALLARGEIAEGRPEMGGAEASRDAPPKRVEDGRVRGVVERVRPEDVTDAVRSFDENIEDLLIRRDAHHCGIDEEVIWILRNLGCK